MECRHRPQVKCCHNGVQAQVIHNPLIPIMAELWIPAPGRLEGWG